MADDGALRLRGWGVSDREKPKEFLSNSLRSGTTYNLSFPDRGRSPTLHNDNWGRSSPGQGKIGTYSSHTITETPTINDLEESLQKLKIQVDSLASSLSLQHPDQEYDLDLASATDSGSFSSVWPTALTGSYGESSIGGPPKPPAESEWFLKPKHLLRPVGDYSALTNLGLPPFTPSPVDRLAGLLGSEIASQHALPFLDLALPLKLGPPHVIGVKSLLPPKLPVRAASHLNQTCLLNSDHSGITRSQSFSPAPKRTRWLRSRSQSPRPVWRPNSAKANACSQPPPYFGKPKSSRKKSRQSRSRIYRPGTLALRARSPTGATAGRVPRDSWTPYSRSSATISSPTAQEINERFLQTLAEGAAGRSLIEMSPYQQELARLRLERLRVEEAWLLELKRQQELERTRGPKPKWYEMRSSQFHYEARKNNELLRNSQNVQSVCKYRLDLATASKEFQQQQPPPPPSSSSLEIC